MVEVGVYRGHTLLATALLLRELGSQKKVFGFDSFRGFPKQNLEEQLKVKVATSELNLSSRQQGQAMRLRQIKEGLSSQSSLGGDSILPRDLSSSGDFSESQKSLLEQKIDFLGLNNIVLVDGYYDNSMVSRNLPKQVYAGFFDCDLYESYTTSLGAICPLLLRGSFLYMDEYYSLKFPEARVAIDRFLRDEEYKKICYSGMLNDEFERVGFVKL